MKKLFISLLMILPLLTLCQESEKVIYKNNQGNWITDQATQEASYYAKKERDNLLIENEKLRNRITDLEKTNSELIVKVNRVVELFNEQLEINQTATTQLNQTNDEIISVWSKLYKGAHLNANAFFETSGVFYTSLYLSAPLDLKWGVSASVLYGLNLEASKPSYLFGLSYNIF